MERIRLEPADESAEPLRLELESFVAATQGREPVIVTGADGREALALALRIMGEIERSLPALAGAAGRAEEARTATSDATRGEKPGA